MTTVSPKQHAVFSYDTRLPRSPNNWWETTNLHDILEVAKLTEAHEPTNIFPVILPSQD